VTHLRCANLSINVRGRPTCHNQWTCYQCHQAQHNCRQYLNSCTNIIRRTCTRMFPKCAEVFHKRNMYMSSPHNAAYSFRDRQPFHQSFCEMLCVATADFSDLIFMVKSMNKQLQLITKRNSVAFSLQANYMYRAAAACRRSYCQLPRVEGCPVVSTTDPHCR
jgi:hypothetical protein